MPVDQNLIKHTVQLLANAEPRTYDKLIRLCDQYVMELMDDMTRAPTDEILVAQGRAQQGRKFMQLLTEKPANMVPKPTA